MKAICWDGDTVTLDSSYSPPVPDQEWLGKRVVGEINFGCGKCEFCPRDLSRHCSRRTVMGILSADGAFAEYVAVPVENLHLVPDSVSDEQAVFTEPLAGHLRYFNRFKLARGTRS